MTQHPQMPGNSEAEEQILACILSNPRSIVRVIDTLKPEHFVTDEYGNIYDCMVALTHERKTPNAFNVADELVRRATKPLEIKQKRWEMEQLSMTFALDAHMDDYVSSIIRASKNRRLIQAAGQIVQAAYHQDANSVDLAEELIAAIALDNDLRGVSTFAQALDRYMDAFAQRRKDAAEGISAGVKTGFKYVDRMIGGFRPGTLNILGARTSIGKTSFALAIAANAAKEAIKTGLDVLFFSLEMQEGELVQRILSMDTMIDQSLLRDAHINQDDLAEIEEKARALRQIGLHIADSVYRLDAIKSSARLLCARRSVGLVIVDYLQLVDLPAGERGKPQRHEMIAEISRSLKRLGQELNVPVLALAQLNREAEKSETPQLHHIGDSDGIGRDADLVAFLHVDAEQMVLRNKAEDYFIDFIVRKQRNGPLGQERLWFRPRQTRFEDVSAF